MSFFNKNIVISFAVISSFLTMNSALALPQYKRLFEREYGFKAPCATCHSQGGGSSLSAYGKAFDRSGKNAKGMQMIASQIPKGDTLSFGEKLKAKANPNDPKSTPQNPGDWAGGSEIPVAELKTFTPAEATEFSVLEGELKAEQIAKMKSKVGDNFQEEDKYPIFYFGIVGGKRTYVVQYVRVPKLKKAIGFVVNTSGTVNGMSYVGASKVDFPAEIKNVYVGKKLTDIEKIVPADNEGAKEIHFAVLRGLNSIQAVFSK